MFRSIIYPFFLGCAVAGLMCNPSAELDFENVAGQIYSAQQNKQIPPKTSDLITNLNVDKAFRIQFILVEKKVENLTRSGFKAGLTSKAGQQRFNVDYPVAGVLFSQFKRNPGDTIFLSDYNQMMVETELGYYLNTEVNQKIESVQALKSLVDFVLPVLEFPNAAFGDNPTANDIISANAGSAFYITGSKHPVQNHDVNKILVNIHKATTLLNSGKGSDALGDQWETLLWLVNLMVDQGYTIGPDHLLITGALGMAFPGEIGEFIADFGELGQIKVTIK